MYSARSRSRGRRVRSGGRDDHHRGHRSRSRHGEGGGRRRRKDKDGRDDDRLDEFGAAAAWGPYAGYGAYAAAAASYWDYAQHAQQAAAEEDKKKKKKKKKKRAGQSSSSSSSSSSEHDAATQWAEMWRSWQSGTPSGAPPAQGHPMAWNQWGGVPPPAPGWPGAPPEGGSMASFEGDTGWAVAEREDDERSGPPEDVPIFLEPSVEDEVPVPKALLGKVIGKQAATIIEIREKSGAFKVDARDQTSDPCMVKVAGTAEAVKKAKELILELIDQTKQKHLSSHYVEIPRSKIGMVIGLKGAQVNEVQAQTQTKIDVDFETDPCKCYIKGEADNVDRAKKVLLTIAMQLEDEASEYMDLPKTVSGALIGAQGSRIRQFQETSGARIDIDKSGSRCKVRLTGSQEAVSIAKSLIQAELEKNMVPTKTPGMTGGSAGLSHGPIAVPAHQPSSFPATLSESIARARAAAEAVKHGLIPTAPPEGSPVNPPPPAPPVVVPPPPRPPGAPKGGHWGGGGGSQWGCGW
ncbi:FUBP3 [Symbiodinium natans]|uniref:FUBP3 protein n=1 Tax=Symbiodinium natans TaxID=878477 RepID=A0A812S1U9_9DINO|nr:FUBP3 [Symbiodinium natans]